jgi:hypothetical protein
MLVIARAYGNQPLKRVVTGTRKKLVYLLNPMVASSVGITPLAGVGFPKDAIYEFDAADFAALTESWEGVMQKRLRQRGCPLNPYAIL